MRLGTPNWFHDVSTYVGEVIEYCVICVIGDSIKLQKMVLEGNNQFGNPFTLGPMAKGYTIYLNQQSPNWGSKCVHEHYI